MSNKLQESSKNFILAAIPNRILKTIIPYSNRVELAKGQVLYEAGEVVEQVYFPTHAIISILNTTTDGWSVQLALIGKEGIVGITGLLEPRTIPYRAVVQIPGGALQMSLKVLKSAFHRHDSVKRLLLLHLHSLLTQLVQSATCNRFHSAEQRLARFLLSFQDRTETMDLPFTQDLISLMLGSRRPTVTLAVRRLQKAGLINCARGHLTILDREGLELVSCECYRITRSEFDWTLRGFVS